MACCGSLPASGPAVRHAGPTLINPPPKPWSSLDIDRIRLIAAAGRQAGRRRAQDRRSGWSGRTSRAGLPGIRLGGRDALPAGPRRRPSANTAKSLVTDDSGGRFKVGSPWFAGLVCDTARRIVGGRNGPRSSPGPRRHRAIPARRGRPAGRVRRSPLKSRRWPAPARLVRGVLHPAGCFLRCHSRPLRAS
jgi:hypothetical protein